MIAIDYLCNELKKGTFGHPNGDTKPFGGVFELHDDHNGKVLEHILSFLKTTTRSIRKQHVLRSRLGL